MQLQHPSRMLGCAFTHSAPPEYPYFPKFIQGPDVCASLTESRNGKGSFNKAAAVRPPKARLFTLHRAIIHAYTTLAQDCKSDRRKIQRADNCAEQILKISGIEKSIQRYSGSSSPLSCFPPRCPAFHQFMLGSRDPCICVMSAHSCPPLVLL